MENLFEKLLEQIAGIRAGVEMNSRVLAMFARRFDCDISTDIARAIEILTIVKENEMRVAFGLPEREVPPDLEDALSEWPSLLDDI